MVHGRAAANRTESQAIDFLVGVEGITGELYTDIAVDAGVVAVVVTSVDCGRATLDLHCLLVVAGLSADDESAPVAGTPLPGSLCRGHYHRRVLRAVHLDISSGFHDERRHSLLVALDDGSGGYAEFRSGIHIDPSLEQIDTLLKSHVAGKVEVLGTIAEFLALVEEYALAVGHVPFVGHFRVCELGRIGFVV